MSRHNKVNPDHYTTQGRLSQDDLARERRKQSESHFGAGRAKSRKATPPWMANDTATDNDGEQRGAGADPSEFEDGRDTGDEDNADGAQAPQGKPRANARGMSGTSASRASTGNNRKAAKKPEARKMTAGKPQTGASTRGTAGKAAKSTPSRPSAAKRASKQAAGTGKRKSTTKTAASRATAGRGGAAKKSGRTSAAKKSGVKKIGKKTRSR